MEGDAVELTIEAQPFLSNLLSSATSAVVGRSICHPIDTIKSKLQATDSFLGIRDAVQSTLRKEGFAGLYRGIGAVLVGGIPGLCVYLTSYDYFKARWSSPQSSSSQNMFAYFASGMVAEAACCTIFIPVDVVKERLQVQLERRTYNYRGTLDAFKSILREEGLGALYKGYFATLFSYGPFSAVYFLLYEWLKEKRSSQSSGEINNFYDNLTISAIAGGTASFVTNPLDLAKLRIQVQQSHSITKTETISTITLPEQGNEVALRYKGFFHALSEIYRKKGVYGLFRGAGTRVMFHTPSTAITMAVYEESKIIWSQALK